MEDPREAEKASEEALELSGATQLPKSTNCLACSEDGRLLGLGHSRGLSVWCAASLIRAADWLQDKLEITALQMTTMAEAAYLIGTIDDMGVARVFAYQSHEIHLLGALNVMEDINKRSVCLTFELSQGGHCGAATIRCNGEVWLQVHHFPLEAWLKELKEAAGSQTQGPNSLEDVEIKWSPLSEATKINPPKIPAGTELEDQREVQAMDFLMHNLVVDKDSWSPTFKTDAESTKKSNETTRHCTHHFLLPCGQFPGDSKTKAQPERPVAVCAWWTGSHNLLRYSLQKAPAHKPDVQPTPDFLWPHAEEILCSAVSRCTRYIAVGLDKALACVWDRHSGSPLSVVLMSAADSAVVRMQFVDRCPVSSDEVHLLVVCKSGAIHTVTAGRGTRPRTMLLSKRPKDSGSLLTITAPVPFLQTMFLAVQRNGKMFLRDVVNKTTVCFLIPPESHLISSPCNPVYALNNKKQTLFVRGDQDSICRTSPEEDVQSQLLTFHFGEWDVLKQYIISPRQQRFGTQEEICDLYLQQRALSLDERSKAIAQISTKLQESTVIALQRDSRAAAN